MENNTTILGGALNGPLMQKEIWAIVLICIIILICGAFVFARIIKGRKKN